MRTLEKALLKVKKNPNKYIGKKSMERLNLFILGYTQSQSDEDGSYSDWLTEFSDFIQRKYNIQASVSFSEIIRIFSASDKHAFDRFYELLEEYYRKKQGEFS